MTLEDKNDIQKKNVLQKFLNGGLKMNPIRSDLYLPFGAFNFNKISNFTQPVRQSVQKGFTYNSNKSKLIVCTFCTR